MLRHDSLCADDKKELLVNGGSNAILLGLRESIQKKPQDIPVHVAIIPDGNRRWAKRQRFGITRGHNQGAENVMAIMRTAKSLGIQYMTFYLFSTENWHRDPLEVRALMHLLNRFIIGKRAELVQEGIRFHTIGNLSLLNRQINVAIEETKAATVACKEANMILALNYGARDELARAFKKILGDIKSHKISESVLDESVISRYLDTAGWPDPDLLIRTGGAYRISNYLLWQLSYSELYMSETLWPEFSAKDFLEAIVSYQGRERRFGGG